MSAVAGILYLVIYAKCTGKKVVNKIENWDINQNLGNNDIFIVLRIQFALEAIFIRSVA